MKYDALDVDGIYACLSLLAVLGAYGGARRLLMRPRRRRNFRFHRTEIGFKACKPQEKP